MRIAVHPGLRGLHAHFAEHLDGHLPGLLLADALVQADDLHDLIAAGVDGVEGGHGLLKYHGYPVAAYAAQLVVAHLEDVAALEQNLPAVDAGGRRGDEPHYLARGHALTGTGLADHAECLAALDVKRHASYNGGHHAVVFERNLQVLDLNQSVVHCRLLFLSPL